ncbi:sulfite reductase flavoprotein subunit alpha [Stenotrophomonas maltophilia]|uniref:sulfite reductase flavoprotein subunit alpha n=1 Tax=Stenotrophomonas maltophilia TaxID=40324 RepID=UPI0021CA4CB7|nr:sulfite reductase flavoprotein subunit alpha [Stenotrophomonas maltophilia]MCU1091162.1 sulfite reductase flavoprotein subunit alpha [Stenotrophomonas maltophilia]
MNTIAATPVRRLLVGFASESGNARALAQRLGADPGLQALAPQVLPFNDIDVASLGQGDVLLAISSSFGDGEPPANGERFFQSVCQTGSLPGLRYAVFGLGDTGYPRFCGFTRALDAALSKRQAQPLLRRVDADLGYERFFQQWQPVLRQVLEGDAAAGQDLHLQVTAYGDDNAFAAPIVERRRVNSSDPAAWHLQLDIAGSGMAYRAGDTVHVLPDHDPALLQALATWYGDNAAIAMLQDRELRLLGRGVLRELARLGDSERLKSLLKVSQKRELDAYLHGLDVLDILQDHASPDRVPLARLRDILSARLPRAYSIASHPGNGQLSLCIREVRYSLRGRERSGTATGSLLRGGSHARVYCRSNPGFHLADTGSAPLLLIGTGTGIAPLIGLVQQVQANGCGRELHLVFGEKHCEHDYLYREQLQDWHARGVLAGLHPAFSRDGTEKVYVQHVLRQRAREVRQVLSRGGHLYLCGNKRHLEDAVREAIDAIGGQGHWDLLRGEGRIHCELY